MLATYFCNMLHDQIDKRELYYTHDHEWIDFQGSIAYIGISGFKITGFRAIQQIEWMDTTGLILKESPLAKFTYNDYTVHLHMPVDGKIMELNESFINAESEEVFKLLINETWVALIAPEKPYERKNLLHLDQYNLKRKSKKFFY